jgi:hypothetical protein
MSAQRVNSGTGRLAFRSTLCPRSQDLHLLDHFSELFYLQVWLSKLAFCLEPRFSISLVTEQGRRIFALF